MKIRLSMMLPALGAALLLPAAGLAQGMGPTGMGDKIAATTRGTVAPAQVLHKLWKQEGGEFMAMAAALPADKFNFAPTDETVKGGTFDGVRTWAQEIKHVTEVNYGLLAGFDLPGAVRRADVEKLQSRDQVLAALKGSYAYLQKGIETVTPQNAFEDMDGKENTRFGTIAYALIHNNDHLGQMVVYLRMNGLIPPESRPTAK